MIRIATWVALIYLGINDALTFGRFVGVILVSILVNAVAIEFKKWRLRGSPLEEANKREEGLRDRIEALKEEIRTVKETAEVERRVYMNSLGNRVTQAPPGKVMVSDTSLTAIRNLLMRHHESRQTQDGYRESGISKQTNDTVAALNGYLQKK